MPTQLPALPADNTTICVVLPDSPEFRQLYMGALLQLTRWWYYDVQGPEYAEAVVQRVMECHWLTTQNYEDCMQLDCNDVLQCIIDSPDIQSAISALARTQAFDVVREYAQSQNGVGFAGGSNPACNLDVLWAQSLQLVEHYHTVNLEFFAKIEVANNDYEMVSEVVGAVTLIDESSLDAVLQYVDFVLNNISENYVAQATIAYQEQLACDVFCIAKEANCEITPELIFNILRERLSATVTIGSLISETIGYLVIGQWSGEEIADFMYFSQTTIRSQIGKFIGIDSYVDVNQRLAIAVNDANNDHLLLCACAPAINCDIMDFTGASYGFTTYDISGVSGQQLIGAWNSGIGWESSFISYGTVRQSGIAIIFALPANTYVESIELTHDITYGASNDPLNVYAGRIICGTVDNLADARATANGMNIVTTINPQQIASTIKILSIPQYELNADTDRGYAKITSLKVFFRDVSTIGGVACS